MFELIIEIIKSVVSFCVSSFVLLLNSIPGMLSFVLSVLSLLIIFRFIGLPILGGAGFGGSLSDMSGEIRSAARRRSSSYSVDIRDDSDNGGGSTYVTFN